MKNLNKKEKLKTTQKEEFSNNKERAIKGISIDKVISLNFSRNYYEVEVRRSDNSKDVKSFFAFLQIDENGIIDSFCSCPFKNDGKKCKHIEIAYKYITKEKKPLHILYNDSFIKSIFTFLFEKADREFKNLNFSEKKLTFSKNNKEIFSFSYEKDFYQKINSFLIENRKEKIEDTIKYASLSFDEIEKFNKGQLDGKTLFDLSIFSDMAKKIFLSFYRREKYEVSFDKVEKIPNKIKIKFSDFSLSINVSKEEFIDHFLTKLNTIKAPLKIYSYENDAIKNLFFNEEKRVIEISYEEIFLNKINKIKKAKKETYGKYFFLPKIGFFDLKKPKVLKDHLIEEEDFLFFFENYFDLVEKFLKFDKKEQKVKYHLFIDLDKNLHINSYLFKKDDFKNKKNIFFAPFAFLEDIGFCKLKDCIFSESEMIIKKENVSNFITQNKTFFQDKKGFKLQIGEFKEKLNYKILDNGDLFFDATIIDLDVGEKAIDYGFWIYIEKKGFYAKTKISDHPIIPLTTVKKEDISSFINNHFLQLENVSNFFLKENPIEQIGLEIDLKKDEKIFVKPNILYKEGIKDEELLFYDNVVYLKKRGFYLLESSFLNLPKQYQKEKIIEDNERDFFIDFQLKQLAPFTLNVNKKLKIPEKIKLKLNYFKKNRKSYLAEIVLVSNLGKVSFIDLYTKLKNIKGKYIFTNAGLFDVNDERFSYLKNLNEKKILTKSKKIRLSFIDWIKISSIFEIIKPRGKKKKDLQIKSTLEALEKFSYDEKIPLDLLNASLRPYQLNGLKWLYFLYTHGLSGLLCDEMGLGKTHQAMALLSAIKKDKNAKFLVVCPTSVIYHWEKLISNFLPSFKVCIFHGSNRELKEDFDVLLTSYGIMRQEIKKISKINFEIAIYDEVQMAKNYLSKTYKALKKVKSKMRLGLTGTPIENRLRELKSIFDLVLKDYLPKESKFKSFFIDPIEKENNKERKMLLKNLVKPFILRRKKSSVLSELPEKIEEIIYADLISDQVKLYDEILNYNKKKLINDLNDKSKKIDYMHIFSILSKLKQICDHPAIYEDDVESYEKYSSGKWELFKELLEEALQSNQKIVIFSQYLKMLEIIERYLKSKKINYAKLTGKTVNRKQQIEKFKNESSCRVFLASLLAAGVGIDLTSASIVIHYDRWWNPAKEDQATDRVHRIGQNRGVQVLKLVTKNTIEERIHYIIDSKKMLIEETISKDDSLEIKMFSRKELLNIFKNIELNE